MDSSTSSPEYHRYFILYFTYETFYFYFYFLFFMFFEEGGIRLELSDRVTASHYCADSTTVDFFPSLQSSEFDSFVLE